MYFAPGVGMYGTDALQQSMGEVRTQTLFDVHGTCSLRVSLQAAAVYSSSERSIDTDVCVLWQRCLRDEIYTHIDIDIHIPIHTSIHTSIHVRTSIQLSIDTVSLNAGSASLLSTTP